MPVAAPWVSGRVPSCVTEAGLEQLVVDIDLADENHAENAAVAISLAPSDGRFLAEAQVGC